MSITIYICFIVALALSLYEFIGVFSARLKGITKNTRRVLIRFSVFILLVMLFWQFYDWNRYILSLDPKALTGIRFQNIPFVVCVLLLALITFFIITEVIGLYSARKKGLTKNISRFISALVILVCLIPILVESMRMWEKYTMLLESEYRRSDIISRIDIKDV